MTCAEPDSRPTLEELINSHQYLKKDCAMDYREKREKMERVESEALHVC
jgi:hypothetical protein